MNPFNPVSRPFAPPLQLRRRVIPLLMLLLLLTGAFLASTMSLSYFGGTGMTTLTELDPLEKYKLAARAAIVAVAFWLFIDWNLRLRQLCLGGVGWLFAFFAFALATSVISPLPTVSATRAVTFLATLFFGGVLVQVFARLDALSLLWRGLYLCVGVWALAVLAGSLALSGLGGGPFNRLYGLYTPTLTAALGGVIGVWAFVRLLRDGPSLLDLIFAGTGLALVVLSVSRGAMVATALACALYTMRRRRVVETLALALILLGMPLLVYGFQNDIIESTTGFLTRGQDAEELYSMTGRLPLYIYLLTEQFPAHPFIGVGFEMLSETGFRPTELPSITISGDKAHWVWRPSHAHNALIHTLIGTGIIGLTLFLIGWGKVARNVYVLSRMNSSVGEEAWFVLIFMFTHAMIDTTLTATVDPPFILASFMCGLATLVADRRSPPVSTRPMRRPAGVAT